jgi:hypothetical protein
VTAPQLSASFDSESAVQVVGGNGGGGGGGGGGGTELTTSTESVWAALLPQHIGTNLAAKLALAKPPSKTRADSESDGSASGQLSDCETASPSPYAAAALAQNITDAADIHEYPKRRRGPAAAATSVRVIFKFAVKCCCDRPSHWHHHRAIRLGFSSPRITRPGPCSHRSYRQSCLSRVNVR